MAACPVLLVALASVITAVTHEAIDRLDAARPGARYGVLCRTERFAPDCSYAACDAV
jgi:hypothetical protein